MKSISASIVIFAGVSAMTACGFIGHGDTQVFVGMIGGGVTLVGFAVWFRTLRLSDRD
ncbi:MAG: hypothetical protein ACI8P0_002948 [Planctomycetaceae bacterium]|jgi:hypothetical protein